MLEVGHRIAGIQGLVLEQRHGQKPVAVGARLRRQLGAGLGEEIGALHAIEHLTPVLGERGDAPAGQLGEDPEVLAAAGPVEPRSEEQVVRFAMGGEGPGVAGFGITRELLLVEPLRTLFKDEVRHVGEQLGLPASMVWRHPFPGPGLAIRIIGAVNRNRLDILREADAIAREELTAAGLDRDVWQFPVVLLADVRSVGVQGDGRTYGHPVVLRPVSSEDAMTADWSRLPYEVLARISTRITNEVRDINRVVLDVTSKPPGTIEWE